MEMEMEFIRKLPTPAELKEQFPLPKEIRKLKEQRDQEFVPSLKGTIQGFY